MTVASKPFFLFLAVTLVAYHLLRRRRDKYLFLTVASWAFYAWAAPQYLWVLLLLTGIDYVAGRRIADAADARIRRHWLTLSIVSNLGLLAAFKYTAFVYDSGLSLARLCGADAPDRAWSILLPLGISFHTFQGISYTVDVYRRRIPAVHSFIDYAFFVAFFPQLAAGPIVRAAEFLPQMVTPPAVTARQVTDGIALFVCGLFKKLVIADQLDALFVSPVFADPGAFDPAAHRWAVAAWAVQIYCDFSGYSDIAIGVAKWFGFELPGNFHLPYLATSIPDFWRRWHLSLSTWLRDYLYFPLGGSRGSEARTYLNLTLVFVLCGLWHGAAWNWLVYGLFNGLLMCLHRGYDRSLTGVGWAATVRASAGWKVVAWAGTAVLFLVGLILIRMDSWAGGWMLMQSLVGLGGAGNGVAPAIPPAVPLLVALGMAGHVGGLVRETVSVGEWRFPEAVRTAGASAALAAVVVFAPGVGKTFIYIQF